jgi:hypothetical protein
MIYGSKPAVYFSEDNISAHSLAIERENSSNLIHKQQRSFLKYTRYKKRRIHMHLL